MASLVTEVGTWTTQASEYSRILPNPKFTLLKGSPTGLTVLPQKVPLQPGPPPAESAFSRHRLAARGRRRASPPSSSRASKPLLKKQSLDPSRRPCADYFDVAAGSGAGGVLAAMLFTRGQDGRPLFTAEESFKFLAKNRKMFQRSGRFRKLFGSSKSSSKFKKLFGDACLRQDSIKPLLVSCFDLLTGSAFMFSRSDAVESDGFNFLIKDVCAATCADRATEVESVDGRTGIKAMGGGVGMGNPTAAAITHVLNNKREFPFADGAEDLLVVSLGSSEALKIGSEGCEDRR
ncbi:patatin-like protein 3 [Asparagus officinalis]|uniref:patatin-like protein 3 n=1 Tax=Asparagus officinalis TaxID=4686 RepID=UPI00098E804E|nr:patatin-like protein 3 [Asparagus officinalis]